MKAVRAPVKLVRRVASFDRGKKKKEKATDGPAANVSDAAAGAAEHGEPEVLAAVYSGGQSHARARVATDVAELQTALAEMEVNSNRQSERVAAALTDLNRRLVAVEAALATRAGPSTSTDADAIERRFQSLEAALGTRAGPSSSTDADAIERRFQSLEASIAVQAARVGSGERARERAASPRERAPKVAEKPAAPVRLEGREPASPKAAPPPAASPQYGGGGDKCAKCGRTVYAAERIAAKGVVLHRDCFRCAQARRDRGVHSISARLAYDGGHFGEVGLRRRPPVSQCDAKLVSSPNWERLGDEFYCHAHFMQACVCNHICKHVCDHTCNHTCNPLPAARALAWFGQRDPE